MQSKNDESSIDTQTEQCHLNGVNWEAEEELDLRPVENERLDSTREHTEQCEEISIGWELGEVELVDVQHLDEQSHTRQMDNERRADIQAEHQRAITSESEEVDTLPVDAEPIPLYEEDNSEQSERSLQKQQVRRFRTFSFLDSKLFNVFTFFRLV